MQHLISLKEATAAEIKAIIDLGIKLKQQPESCRTALTNKALLTLFQKTSTRTLLSFHSGIQQLGGYPIQMEWEKSNFSLSPIRYEAAYVSRNCDLIMARLKKHDDLLQLAEASVVPVINGCCDKYHPCQALADLMTVYETTGTFEGVTLTYVGIHNNVANSLMAGCMKVGLRLILVTPIVNEASWDEELMQAALQSGFVERMDHLGEAVAQSDFVYTDTWIDMEFFDHPEYQEEKRRRIEQMLPFQINRSSLGPHSPYIMHDMPIHPGYEIEESLVESERSVIYRQADNRLHVQKALMLHLLGEAGQAGG